MIVAHTAYSIECDDCGERLNLCPMADASQALRDAKHRGAVELGMEIICDECMANRDMTVLANLAPVTEEPAVLNATDRGAANTQSSPVSI